MEVAATLDFCSLQQTSVALGYFDGVHRGHMEVISRAVAAAREKGLRPAVFTFVAQGGHKGERALGGLLLTEAAKERLLESAGVELVLTPRFASFRQMEPEQFVAEVLHLRLRAQVVTCGYDFRFGRAGAGDANALKRLCAPLGIAVEVVPEFRLAGREVSSTRIRTLIAQGEVEEAGRLLGYPFAVEGSVGQGNRLGRTLQFPTVNQRLQEGMVQPRFGVYVSRTWAAGRWWPSVTNVGVKPTVGSEWPVAETNLLGFSGDLYGAEIRVELLHFLRGEQKFASVEALREQIARDVQCARDYFAQTR